MSCATRAELQRFVARGAASPAFVDHVDACPRCAGALQRLAREASPGPALAAPGVPVEAWLMALALAVAVMVWPRPVPAAAGAALEAGVPEAAAWAAPSPPVASLDGGPSRPHQ